MDKQTDKAKAYFIINDDDVVQQAVSNAIIRMFMDRHGSSPQTQRNAMALLESLMDADMRHGGVLIGRYIESTLHDDNPNRVKSSLAEIVRREVRREIDMYDRHMRSTTTYRTFP